MDKLPGARFWLPVHPACAQYKTLISNNVRLSILLPHTYSQNKDFPTRMQSDATLMWVEYTQFSKHYYVGLMLVYSYSPTEIHLRHFYQHIGL